MALERAYRHMLIAERLAVLQSEITVVAATLYQLQDAQELDALNEAEVRLEAAVMLLHEAERLAKARCQPTTLEAQLQSSIELINRSPERARRIKRAALEPPTS